MIKAVFLRDISNFNIYYEDTDFSGFVYHANYLKFFERAREHMIGIELLKSLYKVGLHFVVKSAKLEYKAPAHFADRIEVLSEATFSRSPLIFIKQDVRKDGSLLVAGHIEIVLVNEKNHPQRLDQNLLALLKERAT